MKIADGTGTSNSQPKLFPANNIFGSNNFTPKIEPLNQSTYKNNNSGNNLFQNKTGTVPQPPKLTAKPPPLTNPLYSQSQTTPPPCHGYQKSSKMIKHLFDS